MFLISTDMAVQLYGFLPDDTTLSIRPFGIKYKGLKLLDVPQTNIALHFNEVVQFIEEGLENGGNLK